MNFSIGIIGLPNVGKSTLFKALTQQDVDISNYPFCTIDPNVGIVQVPDEQLEKIAKIIAPQKVTPTIIEFVDIAGLVKGAHKGEGLGNQFLSHIREVDAILHIVRVFQDENIKHVEESIDPKRDIETINMELVMKDLETLERRLEKISKDAKSGDKEIIQELEVLKKIKEQLNKINPISSVELSEKEKEIIKPLSFLSIKPTIYIANTKESAETLDILKLFPENTLSLDLKIELECTDLSSRELKELDLESEINTLIKACYKILNLITFYTIKGGEEVRAWTAKKETTAPKCGGIVHTDFEEKFIRAEVINCKDLLKSGSWSEARTKGLVRTEGKGYVVEDEDIVEFKC
jgi:hypothetical protein